VSAALRGGWRIERRAGTAARLHAPWPEDAGPADRVASLCAATVPAVVLGSSQDDRVVDARRAAAAGIEVARRRSGGGAVLVVPDGQVWLEVWLGREDPLWDDDIVHGARWLGELWRTVLEDLGAAPLALHGGRAVVTEWSPFVCFAGIGPGEVLAGSAKVVGVSQRRTRQGARFSSMAPLRWDPTALVAVLDLPATVARAEPALAHAALGLRAVLAVDDRRPDADVVTRVGDALLHALH